MICIGNNIANARIITQNKPRLLKNMKSLNYEMTGRQNNLF